MDVRLYAAVLWRFKWVTFGGIALGAVLAMLAYGTPEFSHGKPTIVPRSAETWQSQSELLITQSSVSNGTAAGQQKEGSATPGTPAIPVGDQTNMSNLAPIYAALANGDEIQALVHKVAPVGTLTATAVANGATGFSLPFVDLTATAPSSADATRLAGNAASVFSNFVAQQQAATGLPPSDRVQLQTVQNGYPAKLVSGHKLSVPLLVFVAVFGAAIALAFVLESASPRTAVAFGRVQGQSSRSTQDAPIASAPDLVRLQAASRPGAEWGDAADTVDADGAVPRRSTTPTGSRPRQQWGPGTTTGRESGSSPDAPLKSWNAARSGAPLRSDPDR